MGNIKTRAARLFTGSILMGIGVNMAVSTGFGSDSLGFLWEAIALRWEIPLSLVNMMLSAVFLLTTFIIDKKQIHIGTIITPILQSLIMEVTLPLFSRFTILDKNIVWMVAGIAVLSVGCGLCAAAELGKASSIAFDFAISGRIHVPVGMVTSSLSFCYAAGGILLGNTVKPGPVVSVLIMGGLIEFTYKWFLIKPGGSYKRIGGDI